VDLSKSAFSLGWNFGESSVQQIGLGIRARCPVTDAKECLLIDSISIYEALVTQKSELDKCASESRNYMLLVFSINPSVAASIVVFLSMAI
jgi:hypothetical protein